LENSLLPIGYSLLGYTFVSRLALRRALPRWGKIASVYRLSTDPWPLAGQRRKRMAYKIGFASVMDRAVVFFCNHFLTGSSYNFNAV
jgi:hypothetical protein